MRSGLIALLCSALLTMAAPAPLWAHGKLKSSTPAAGAHLAQVPLQLRLEFTESVELAFTLVRLASASGQQIALAPLALATDSRRAVVVPITGAMDASAYVVTWQVAGDDGHPVRGRFEFVVAPGATGAGSTTVVTSRMHHDPVTMPEGNGFGAESGLYVVVRWLQFISLLLVIGAVSFRFFVLGRLPGASMPESGHAVAALAPDAARRAAGWGLVAANALAATLPLRLAAQSYAMHGASVFDASLIGSMIRTTVWGWGWLLQLAGVVLAVAGFHGVRSASRNVLRPGAARGRGPSAWWGLAACGAVVAAFSPALSGHASGSPRLRSLAIVSDGVHVLGASAWLGTLAILLVAGVAAATGQGREQRGMLVRSLVTAFSPVALASAGIAAATGVFASWLHIGTIPNLWGTRYGITLLIKLGILGIVALTGFYNWRFVQPRLGTDEATMRLQRSSRLEVAVAVLVLLVTAVLVASPTSMDGAT